MAIDAATIDTAAASRPVLRERPASPIVNDGHNSRGVEIKGEMSFGDFLDIINPLQHIPIVGNIYREITGDTIKPSSKVIGGILYGGPVGGMASIANAVVEEAQGKDFGDQIMASLGFGSGDHMAPDAHTAVAAKPDPANPSGAIPNGANPATATAVAAAQAVPPQVAAADKPVRLAASAAPPAGVQTAAQSTAARTAAAQTTAAQTAAGDAAPHATRMPPRDTPLANSMMARQAAPKFAAPMHGSTLVHGQAAASGHAGSSAGSAATAGQGGSAGAAGAASGAAGSAAAGSAMAGSAAKTSGGLMLEAQDGAAPHVMTPVSPDMLSETMMRNLAKYEQSRKAAQSAAPSLRVSG